MARRRASVTRATAAATRAASTGAEARPFTPGPRKARRKGAPPARLSNHKTRSLWFRARAAWPVREAPVHALVMERRRARARLESAATAGPWQCIGPTNVGGRMTCVAVHPADPDRLWAGAAGGGVWFSPDAGRTWQPQWHDQEVLNVGAIAIDPGRPSRILCGTGEANLSADSYPGVGLYSSADAGRTWRLSASCERAGLPSRIGVIAFDPFDPRHVRLGGIGFAETSRGGDVGGMYTSRDGGVTWARETFVSASNYWCHAIVFQPRRRGVLFATVTERGARNGIYRSTDGGASWQQLTRGLPPPERFHRTSLAISPSDPNVMYAFATDAKSDGADLLLGVFRSADGGTRWTSIGGRHFQDEAQISYGNTIVVHPTRPNHVLCGGVDLHLTRDGGRTWKKVTAWDAVRGRKGYAHADHHGLVMPAGAPGRVYDPNDGGLDVSEDGGGAWTNRSNGLAATMYYDMDVAQSDGKVFGGGAQDNGTLVTTTGASNDHFELLGGDGGWIVFDPADAGHVYASYYNLNLYRFLHGRSRDVSPPASESEQGSVWMAYIDMDPSDPRTVFTGSTRVWVTRDDGATWKATSPTLDGSAISAIEIAAADPRRIYVGTENGGLFRSMDGGRTWSASLAGSVLPGHTITRLATHPTRADVVYATVANFGHAHVFRSRDAGGRWVDIDRGQLPDVPHAAIVIPKTRPGRLYVANDAGVFMSPDDGATWRDMSANLPNVMVVDLVLHEHDGTLSAATYGRSLWRVALAEEPR